MLLEEILDQALRKSTPHEQAGNFLGEHVTRPRYAIGKNPETLAVHELAPLDGIIDDYAQQGEAWHGIPLLRTVDAARNARVINCSTSIRPVDVLEHLQRSGFGDVINIADLVRASDGALPWPRLVEAQRREMAGNLDVWQAIHDELADEESRKTLLDVLRFRLTADPDYMHGYKVRLAEQYFEDFMQYREETFVDAGGYDGDTSEAFAKRIPITERSSSLSHRKRT